MAKFIVREKLTERREAFLVEYAPAVESVEFAIVDLTYIVLPENRAEIKTHMENELTCWLKRYPVPVMVFSWDRTDEMIRIEGESTLMGYILSDGKIQRKWGTFENADLPAAQLTEEHRKKVYADVKSTEFDSEQRKSELLLKAKADKKASTVIFVLIIIVPLAFEAVAFGWSLLGNIVGGISIGIGIYKAAKKFGWIKKTATEIEEEEKNRKMRHYYYHCEKNPSAFARLKVENFRRESAENNEAQFRKLKGGM